MNIEIRDIRKKDYEKAIQFAIKGMHFDWYLNNKFLLNVYGRYFWYLEVNRATQILAAYVGGNLRVFYWQKLKVKKRKSRVFCKKSMSNLLM